MNSGIIIAIDGFSACGKSTLARALAQRLGYTYIDTGAMYRAVALYFLRHQIPLDHEEAVEKALANIHIRFVRAGDFNQTVLNQENVEEAIRSMEVSNYVSPVATVSAVRRFLVQQQQEMGREKSCILDGRDIGTVVFPDAALKIFLTADADERARRRMAELSQKGQSVSMEAVKENLLTRDHIDSSREDSPLKKAPDAVLFDNTALTPDEQLAMITTLAKMRGA
ncbi:MAG: (d)CMP kinase [Saprospiraceae bacterium]